MAMAPVAWLFARRMSSSVALFAAAAERLGRDPNAPPLTVKGPREIVPAISAFNDMQDRIRRYVSDRTAMAAAVAHDLRTPLTRLRFRIEAAAPEARSKMAADIDEMEAMVAATLAYAKDAQGAAERTRLELSSLLESVVDDLTETGAQVSIDKAERVVITGDPMGLRRMLINLIENACKFGGGARTRLLTEPGWAMLEIEDDGPGIRDADLDRVFEPFYRAEPSRSRETGGSGLGLAAVRSIARLHGGDVLLRNRPKGGLTAQVRLPV
jgi:signal transduction histidine kinase